MIVSELALKKCAPCERGAPALGSLEIERLLPSLEGWTVEGKGLTKTFKLKSFNKAIVLVNSVARVAEEENHHPDIYIQYNKVRFDLWTHAAGGLTENDFILAAKIDQAGAPS
ncbi:MAG: 4a-hydroxytetrahydrobiopterin dehydratase [Armatimonadetes bacterium]|nr:4a-hydroxytetrahydrobiopterin dehydratase [Armatimonadota bacterium]